MARTTVKVAPAASRVLRKSAIVASLCAAMLVAGMLHPTYAYGDALSDANAALNAAHDELIDAKNELATAEEELTAAQDGLNATITKDVVFSGKTPLYVPVSGNTAKPANSTLVGVEGKYVDGTSDSTSRNQQQILNYINDERRKAANEGLVNKYVALSWSKNLERTAQIRAAEISIYGDHTRPSGESWYGVSDEGLMATSAENLSWGSNYYGNIKMWVDEKECYKKYLSTGKNPGCVYGHYRNLVNPSYNKIGLAQFNSDRSTINPYNTAMAAEFSGYGNSGSSAVKSVNATIYQGVYVKTAAMGSVGTAGATTFNPTKVSGDPVWTRNAQVKEAKALAVSLGFKATTTADVTAAQNKVNAAKTRVANAEKNTMAAAKRVVAAGGTVNMDTLGLKTTWTRLWGNTAYDTMAAIAGAGFSQTGGTVVISTSSGYYDALSASGIAGVENAPILFTAPKSLSAQAKAQIVRLKPSKVIITGGTLAVSDAVVNEIKKTVPNANINRRWGQNAIETANDIAKAGKGKWSKNAIVVTDKSYWDALSVGPYSYAKRAPIFYAKGGTTLTASTLATMKELGIEKVYIIGGSLAVTDNVKTQAAKNNMSVERIWGQNQIHTSQKVAEFSINQGMKADRMGIATTNGYYDGLAASPLLGKNNSVLVLTDSKNLSAIDNVYGNARKTTVVESAYIFGGTSAVNASVENHVK